MSSPDLTSLSFLPRIQQYSTKNPSYEVRCSTLQRITSLFQSLGWTSAEDKSRAKSNLFGVLEDEILLAYTGDLAFRLYLEKINIPNKSKVLSFLAECEDEEASQKSELFVSESSSRLAFYLRYIKPCMVFKNNKLGIDITKLQLPEELKSFDSGKDEPLKELIQILTEQIDFSNKCEELSDEVKAFSEYCCVTIKKLGNLQTIHHYFKLTPLLVTILTTYGTALKEDHELAKFGVKGAIIPVYESIIKAKKIFSCIHEAVSLARKAGYFQRQFEAYKLTCTDANKYQQNNPSEYEKCLRYYQLFTAPEKNEAKAAPIPFTEEELSASSSLSSPKEIPKKKKKKGKTLQETTPSSSSLTVEPSLVEAVIPPSPTAFERLNTNKAHLIYASRVNRWKNASLESLDNFCDGEKFPYKAMNDLEKRKMILKHSIGFPGDPIILKEGSLYAYRTSTGYSCFCTITHVDGNIEYGILSYGLKQQSNGHWKCYHRFFESRSLQSILRNTQSELMTTTTEIPFNPAEDIFNQSFDEESFYLYEDHLITAESNGILAIFDSKLGATLRVFPLARQ